MAAMTFVTLPGQVGPLLGPALGGLLVEYASRHWILFDRHSGGDYRCDRHIDVNAELHHADAALLIFRLFIAGGWHGGINPGAGRQ